ncbi:hypothetical protein [Streptomyces prunicolor]|uniref:Secreted protein n=1 Tax=Streptomyces prunicolor TaxID=67348 RepID=A0ABU4FIL9_9ACTN|nr:hypothetical protein [Streptomyces prunicolor]MDV7220419.1 hypothetical protein [Streptomyces prunicolor]
MSSQLVTAAVTLAGVALGATGTVGAQYLATRDTRKQIAATREAAIRAERKEAILNFLASCQQVEHIAEQRSQNANKFVEDSPGLTHDLWFRQKSLDLVAGAQVRHTAFELANRLVDSVYGDTHRNLHDLQAYLHEKRGPFLHAAKKELGIPQDPDLNTH